MHIFVIMPFSEDLEGVYRDLIKVPLEQEGYIVSRADDPSEYHVYHENIHDQIVQSLWDADYIVADLTGSNPNVTYELGIAHTLNKRTIQIAQSFDQLFDIKSQNVIEYGTEADSPKELPSQLLRALDRAKRGDYVFSNIVSNFARTASRSISTAPPARS